MEDLISRQVVLDAICKICAVEAKPSECKYKKGLFGGCEEYEAIKVIPSAEPKIGHWIDKELVNPEYIYQDRKIIVCSECNFGMIQGILGYTNYCPNCGCRMVEPDEGYANDWIGYSR